MRRLKQALPILLIASALNIGTTVWGRSKAKSQAPYIAGMPTIKLVQQPDTDLLIRSKPDSVITDILNRFKMVFINIHPGKEFNGESEEKKLFKAAIAKGGGSFQINPNSIPEISNVKESGGSVTISYSSKHHPHIVYQKTLSIKETSDPNGNSSWAADIDVTIMNDGEKIQSTLLSIMKNPQINESDEVTITVTSIADDYGLGDYLNQPIKISEINKLINGKQSDGTTSWWSSPIH